jgi:hypothetical protein
MGPCPTFVLPLVKVTTLINEFRVTDDVDEEVCAISSRVSSVDILRSLEQALTRPLPYSSDGSCAPGVK